MGRSVHNNNNNMGGGGGRKGTTVPHTERNNASSMNTERRFLLRLYTDPKSPACFTGVERLLAEARKKYPEISRRQVSDFLATQDVYTRHRRVVRRFRRLPTTAAGLHTCWQADLAVMNHLTAANNGYAYMLVCVDVLSRQLFVAPVRTKRSEHVVAGFEQCFRRARCVPWKLVTDQVVTSIFISTSVF